MPSYNGWSSRGTVNPKIFHINICTIDKALISRLQLKLAFIVLVTETRQQLFGNSLRIVAGTADCSQYPTCMYSRMGQATFWAQNPAVPFGCMTLQREQSISSQVRPAARPKALPSAAPRARDAYLSSAVWLNGLAKYRDKPFAWVQASHLHAKLLQETEVVRTKLTKFVFIYWGLQESIESSQRRDPVRPSLTELTDTTRWANKSRANSMSGRRAKCDEIIRSITPAPTSTLRAARRAYNAQDVDAKFRTELHAKIPRTYQDHKEHNLPCANYRWLLQRQKNHNDWNNLPELKPQIIDCQQKFFRQY